MAESDDDAHPSFLETLLHFAEEYSSAGIVYSNSCKETAADAGGFATTADETNSDFMTNLWDKNHFMKGEEAISQYLCKKNIILNVSSALIKRKCFADLSAMLTRMNYYGDWYCYICIAAKADVLYCSEVLNTFRRHPFSLIERSDPKKVKTDCFRILDLLLKQQPINRNQTIDYFVTNYLSVGLKKEGISGFIRTTAHCFLMNPVLAITTTVRILQLKMKHKKI
jgi:hypothetical protein